ncbi:MAG: VPDSG-CTERM sorting domain-containing protein [Opitutus sp.]
MKSPFSKLVALVGLSVLLVSSASAVTLTLAGNTGMGGAIGGLVGSIDPGSPASLAAEVVYVNNLLGLGANASTSIAGHNYVTKAFDFNGTVVGATALNYPDDPPTTGPSGYTYVLAKLGNTSYVWFVGGDAFDLSTNFGQGAGLSHWVAFTPMTKKVPDGGSTVVLLALGLLGMSYIARRK